WRGRCELAAATSQWTRGWLSSHLERSSESSNAAVPPIPAPREICSDAKPRPRTHRSSFFARTFHAVHCCGRIRPHAASAPENNVPGYGAWGQNELLVLRAGKELDGRRPVARSRGPGTVGRRRAQLEHARRHVSRSQGR